MNTQSLRDLSTRRSQRQQIDCAVQIKVQRPEIETPFVIPGRCRDMSEHGVCAALPVPLEEGEIVTLVLKLSGDMPEQQISGIVRYSNGELHGVEFIGLLPPRKAALREFRTIASNLRVS